MSAAGIGGMTSIAFIIAGATITTLVGIVADGIDE